MKSGSYASLRDEDKTVRPPLNHGPVDDTRHHSHHAARDVAEYDAVVSLHAVTGKEVRGAIKGLFYVADKEWALQLESNQRIVVFNCCLTHNEARRGSFLNAHAALEFCVLATRRSP